MTDQPPILQYFACGHLPEYLQRMSAAMSDLAEQLARLLPEGPELSAGLRKLMEAKDCFVRAALTRSTPHDRGH